MIKILDVEIENFRSITGDSSKSSPVTLELSEFNVIVGQNNSGKSNILRALNLFFNGRTDIGEFDPDIDFSINSNLAGNSQTKITLSIEFTPSTDIKLANAVNSISKETGYKPLGPNRIRIRQMFSRKGTEQWRYIGSGGIKPLKEELLIPLIDAVRSAVRFKYLPVGRDIDSVIQRELKDELVSTIFSGWSSSKQKKKINDAIQKLIESLQPELERTRDEISNTASKVFRELKHLSLELPFEDIDSLLPSLIPTANDGQITALRHKGAGIQTSSLLFYLKFLADHQPQRKYSRPTYIWAIEEPESFLHPTRQREMFDVLRIFSEEVQTLITTHSAHFVPRGEGNKLFLANRELKYPFNTSVSEATYEDARTSLGVTMLDSMVLAPLNVVVEGPSDEILLGNAWRSLSKEGSINFSPDDVKFFPAGNATAACNLYEGFKSYMGEGDARVILILDSDEAGNKALTGLQSRIRSNNKEPLKANHDYFLVGGQTMEWLISPVVMEYLHEHHPAKVIFSVDTNDDITDFRFHDGHKREMAKLAIEKSGTADLEDFKKMIDRIIG